MAHLQSKSHIKATPSTISIVSLGRLASAMRRLAHDVGTRRRMSEAAQRRAHDFNLDTHVDDVLELLSKAIG